MGVRVRCRNESPIITVGVKNVAATKKNTPSAGQSIRSIIWKLCNIFMRQSGKKYLMRGGRNDGCSNMTTRPHIHRSLSVTSSPNTRDCPSTSSVLSRSRTSWLLSVSKAQINAERPPFESIEAIKTNSLAHLRSIPKTAFQECFRTLKKRWQRCIQSRGVYFEGDKAE